MPDLLLGSSANFFVNGFDSEIDGVDLAVTTSFDLGAGDLTVDLRYNYNKQDSLQRDAGHDQCFAAYTTWRTRCRENRGVADVRLLERRNLRRAVAAELLRRLDDDSGSVRPGRRLRSVLLWRRRSSSTWKRASRSPRGTRSPSAARTSSMSSRTRSWIRRRRFLGVNYALTSPYGFNGGFYYLRLSADF